MVGIKHRTGRKVPNIEPRVEMAYIRPDIRPAWSVWVMANLMAKGETQPNNVIGTLNKTNTAKKEPNMTAESKCSTASTALMSTGRAIIGTNPAVNAPQASIR